MNTPAGQPRLASPVGQRSGKTMSAGGTFIRVHTHYVGGWQPGRPPAATIDWQPGPPHPARLLRRAFTLAAAAVAATLTLTALGGCEAELNGQRVGDARLAPENSDFRVRLLVQQHDVTGLLRGGDNVLGVTVADGFYEIGRAHV